ncbi:MAG: CBASS cGAMP synthase [Thermohalobaculum sp.]
MPLNAHKLLGGFWDNISLDDETERKPLIATRDEIRKVLREGFAGLNAGGFSRKAALLKASEATRAKEERFHLTPRFRMQGSFAYFTVNKPAYSPPQNIDLDDGVYLPTSFVDQRAPVVAAKAYFSVVKEILAPVCVRNGWTLGAKRSCVRVILNANAHIDLPLYAIPDDDFIDPNSGLAKAMSGMGLDQVLMKEDAYGELLESVYDSLPSDRIMLATEDGTWEESDPRKMDQWFKGAVADHGQQLRRICRYLKAWRDYQWKSSRLTSICLMACVVTAYDDFAQSIPESRDDLALKEVCARLPDILCGDIPNPVVETALLNDGWSAQDRDDYCIKASSLHRAVCSALGSPTSLEAIKYFRSVLGPRVPEELALVSQDGLQAQIVQHAPTIVPAPVVSRSTSG